MALGSWSRVNRNCEPCISPLKILRAYFVVKVFYSYCTCTWKQRQLATFQWRTLATALTKKWFQLVVILRGTVVSPFSGIEFPMESLISSRILTAAFAKLRKRVYWWFRSRILLYDLDPAEFSFTRPRNGLRRSTQKNVCIAASWLRAVRCVVCSMCNCVSMICFMSVRYSTSVRLFLVPGRCIHTLKKSICMHTGYWVVSTCSSNLVLSTCTSSYNEDHSRVRCQMSDVILRYSYAYSE